LSKSISGFVINCKLIFIGASRVTSGAIPMAFFTLSVATGIKGERRSVT